MYKSCRDAFIEGRSRRRRRRATVALNPYFLNTVGPPHTAALFPPYFAGGMLQYWWGTEFNMGPKIDFIKYIRARVDTHFDRFVLRRAIDTAARRGRVPPTAGWSFATDYAFAIEDSFSEFADLLTQAVLARKRALTKRIFWEIVDAALGWAAERNNWDHAETFVAIAVSKRGRKKVSPAAQKAFLAELEAFASRWQIQAVSAVRLRLALSARPEPSWLPKDPAKLHILLIKKMHPRLSQREICLKLDVYNARTKEAAPLPEEWRRAGHRLWVSAYDDRNLRPHVKTFISKVRS